MTKVAAFTIPGLDLWFNTNDHLPPHLHVRRPGMWEIRVYVLTCAPGRLDFTVKWPPRRAGPTRRERNRILQATLRHRIELLAEWEAKVLVKEKK